MQSNNISSAVTINYLKNLNNYEMFGNIKFNNYYTDYVKSKTTLDTLTGKASFSINSSNGISKINLEVDLLEGRFINKNYEKLNAIVSGKFHKANYFGSIKGNIIGYQLYPYFWENIDLNIDVLDNDSSSFYLTAISNMNDNINLVKSYFETNYNSIADKIVEIPNEEEEDLGGIQVFSVLNILNTKWKKPDFHDFSNQELIFILHHGVVSMIIYSNFYSIIIITADKYLT